MFRTVANPEAVEYLLHQQAKVCIKAVIFHKGLLYARVGCLVARWSNILSCSLCVQHSVMLLLFIPVSRVTVKSVMEIYSDKYVFHTTEQSQEQSFRKFYEKYEAT